MALIPSWLDLGILAFASWRTWCLLSSDDILNRPRRYVTTRIKYAEEFLECPYCSGFWLALGWWGAWQIWPHGTLVAAGAVAVTALVPLIQRVASDD